ncbi:MAG: hypothetical protein HC903_15080 [Methylacidiphilales bacterium]|nr:hypothetical protein [Candidatus Methylacidiphilales bacterium]NJR16885.1 hypothetical protein [Calothrix sp. CSU_2_0]
MWRLPEEIEADLKSGNSDRIAAGLRDLKECMDEFDEFELAPINVDILKPFDNTVNSETQLNLLRILAGYRSFQPPLLKEDINHSLVVLAVRYADDRIALETSLKLKSEQNPPATVEDAISFIIQHGLNTSQQVKGASKLVSYLLAGKPDIRFATLQALQKFPDHSQYQKIIDFIIPELDDEERRMLERA